MELMKRLTERAQAAPKTVVYPEAAEDNILLAARAAADLGAARPVLVGRAADIEAAAARAGVALDGLDIVAPEGEQLEKYVGRYSARPGALPAEAARFLLAQPLNFAAMMVSEGEADAMVAGYSHTTGEVILAGQMIIGLEEGLATPSSLMLMNIPGWEGPEGPLLVFADCAIVPAPTAEELADIAVSTAKTARELLQWEPRVALLSFSTHGSAEHERADLVLEALRLVRERCPDLKADGELQADAALIPSVAAKKTARPSPVAGRANVLIFPDLASANIGYKLVQRLAGADAYGPLLQGFKKTVSDLSRGAAVEDIVGLTVMSVVRAGGS